MKKSIIAAVALLSGCVGGGEFSHTRYPDGRVVTEGAYAFQALSKTAIQRLPMGDGREYIVGPSDQTSLMSGLTIMGLGGASADLLSDLVNELW